MIRLFFAELAARHGSVRKYAINRLGVDGALITALQTQLLTA